MKITENTHPLTKQKSYNIIISQKDNIEAIEIVECFKKQYPNQLALISSAKVIKIEVTIFLVGLNLKQNNKLVKSKK